MYHDQYLKVLNHKIEKKSIKKGKANDVDASKVLNLALVVVAPVNKELCQENFRGKSNYNVRELHHKIKSKHQDKQTGITF